MVPRAHCPMVNLDSKPGRVDFFMIFAPFLMWKLCVVVVMQFSALEGTDLEYENVTQIGVNGTETSMSVTSDNAGVSFGKSSIFKGIWENPPNFSIFEGDHLAKTCIVFFWGIS